MEEPVPPAPRPAPGPGTPLADLDEEEILAAFTPRLPTRGPGLVIGPGDDAAVLALHGHLVVTTDSMLRGIDWRDDWSTPQDVAHKAVTQNLADLAAMGARPVGLLVALAADPATPLGWVTDFASGLADAAAPHCPVVGGDLSAAPAGAIDVAITALGDLEGRSPVTRAGASPGDIVAIHGTLGRSGGGLAVLESGLRDPAPGDESGYAAALRLLLIAHRRAPWDSAAAGVEAAEAGATAMIDLSDGLVRDAARVARASGVILDLDPALLAPYVAGPLTTVLGERAAYRHVLAGGEEHSLLACFPAEVGAPAGWTVIGAVRAAGGTPRVTLAGQDAEVVGWDHFRGRTTRGGSVTGAAPCRSVGGVSERPCPP